VNGKALDPAYDVLHYWTSLVSALVYAHKLLFQTWTHTHNMPFSMRIPTSAPWANGQSRDLDQPIRKVLGYQSLEQLHAVDIVIRAGDV
jgi:hypothetical protein